ncbi:amino acid-binding protein [Methanobrevibacter sp. DSM 116169]|uniref:amino acid-binding protein n=1 Tax=Methanobrevibacter sp. DSM 116169 TaxID=3242727 RepID=UPI0038FBF120
MTVYQISVFIENKEGRLKKAINTLSNAKINIRALSIADTTKYGILRLIVSNIDKAVEALENDGFLVKKNEVIIVKIPDEPNGLNSVLDILDNEKINVEYLYAFITHKIDQALVVMRLEDMEKGKELLKSQNAELLASKDIESL